MQRSGIREPNPLECQEFPGKGFVLSAFDYPNRGLWRIASRILTAVLFGRLDGQGNARVDPNSAAHPEKW